MTLNTKHLVLLPTNCRIFDQVRCLIGHKIGFIIQGSNGTFTNIDHWSLERTRYFTHLAPWVLPSASWHPGAIREGQDRGALPWSQGTGHFWGGDNIEFRTQFCDPCAFMVQWFKLIYEVRGYSKTVESYSTKFIPDILVLLLYWRE